MNANKGLVEEIRSKVKECLKDTDPLSPANQVYLKEKIRNDIGKFIYRKTHRTPMILPVILTM